jgi:L-arabinose transport system permease protein
MTSSNPPVIPVAASSTPHTRQRISLRGIWDSAGMLVVFIVLFTVVSFTVPNFFSLINFKGLALSVATVGIISCTMLFCLAAGDFDLSVGSVVAMAGVLTAEVVNKTGSVPIGIAAGVLAGGVVGFVNGFVIARLGINALITTLATMQIVRGVAFIACHEQPVGVINENFYKLGITSPMGIPTPVWIMVACFIIFGILLNRTTFGRNTLAVGGNKEAAYLAGIRVASLKIVIFTVQGFIAAFAGVILASRMTSGQPNTGQGLELQVISACVLGGVSLTGGVGTITGVIVGVLIMGTVNDSMNLLNIPSPFQYLTSGTILLAAVLFDRVRSGGN